MVTEHARWRLLFSTVNEPDWGYQSDGSRDVDAGAKTASLCDEQVVGAESADETARCALRLAWPKAASVMALHIAFLGDKKWWMPHSLVVRTRKGYLVFPPT